jgi:hypothetical protein
MDDTYYLDDIWMIHAPSLTLFIPSSCVVLGNISMEGETRVTSTQVLVFIDTPFMGSSKQAIIHGTSGGRTSENLVSKV